MGMTFKDAYAKMVAGEFVRRPIFKGYWFLDPSDKSVTICLKNDKKIKYGKLDISIKNTLEDDWEVVDKATIYEKHIVEKPVATEHTAPTSGVTVTGDVDLDSNKKPESVPTAE